MNFWEKKKKKKKEKNSAAGGQGAAAGGGGESWGCPEASKTLKLSWLFSTGSKNTCPKTYQSREIFLLFFFQRKNEVRKKNFPGKKKPDEKQK